ncbi:MAG TPA: ABC transporter permease [Bacillota bacterium]
MSGTGRSASTERRRRSLVAGAQVGIAALVLLAWQALTGMGWLDAFFFSRPSRVLARLWEWVSTGYIWPHLAITLWEAFLAFLLGAALGVAMGFLLARIAVLAEIIEPYIQMLNSIPRLILAPIFTLWFGLGVASKVAFGITIVFFIVFYSTYQGVREVDAVVLNNARMLGASERQLLRHVLIPSALSWIFSSLHTSIGMAIVGAVVGEYLGSARGMGYLIAQAQGVFDTTGMFAGMVMLAVAVMVVDHLVRLLERSLLRWKPAAGAAWQADAS